MTFWEHLDELRGSLIRMAIAAIAMGLVAFAMKETLFDIVLAPSKSDFFLYRIIGAEPFDIKLINTGLAEQFTIHMKVALTVGLLVASPYILYLLFHFVSPALYENEKRYSVRITLSAYLMFIVGVALNYFLVFPLTVRFLGTYSVSADIENMLTLSSYVDSMLMMSLWFGIIFELPVVCWLLGKFGLLKAEWMTRYRRHAIVAILIIAAIITPTGDIFTLMVVSLPIYILYEASAILVRR
ncbi:MAG: twin-arginine translocase subunit TatC [Prevotella sp.]|nr:twin-arginine translocase subunit TatC [Prevotella sp.]MBR4601994.1 twin-arginine translocase subunit TatC [Prevotella sp.]MBR6138603.1 twin-arginine translocase subunit TatC [Prevotella sp.]